jgi:hypothetical protein
MRKPMNKTFTLENDFILTSEKLILLFDAFPIDFFRSEGIAPPEVRVDAIKLAARMMIDKGRSSK